MADSNRIMAYLQRIAETLMFHSSFLYDVGLFNGKMGIAIFFFHLARKTGTNIYEEYACDLIEQMYESMHEHMPADYAGGFSGIGVGMAYLIRQKLIRADADEVLEEIDEAFLHHAQHHLPIAPDIRAGITGLGKYCAMRLLCRKQMNDDDPFKNQLLKIMQGFSDSYDSFEEMLGVIDFLAGIAPLNIALEKNQVLLNHAVNHLERKLLEDIRYDFFSNKIIQLLSVAATMVQTSAKTGDKTYSDKARHYLQLYKPAQNPHFSNENQSDKLLLGFLYQYLGKHFGDNKYLQLSEEALNDFLSQKIEQQASMGLLGGYAGMGMHLLFLSGQSLDGYLDVIPCFIHHNYLNK